MRKTTPVVASICLISLAGCQAGGAADRPTYDALFSEFNTIDSQIDRRNIAAMTDPSTLPTTGGASYTGVLGVNLPASAGDTSLIGDMAMTANFGNSSISGGVDNFVDTGEQQYDGNLTITNGTIFRGADLNSQFTFVADLEGTLANQTGGLFTFNMDLLGDFYAGSTSDNTAFVAGEMNGSVDTPGGQVDYTGTDTYFVAQR